MTFTYSGNGASYSKNKSCDPEALGLSIMLTYESIQRGEADQDERFSKHAEVRRGVLFFGERQRGESG